MKIYQAPVIKSIISFYGGLLPPNSIDTIFEHLNKLAERLYEGLKQQERCLYTQINNYNPDYIGIKVTELKEKKFDLTDCQHTIANEYSFGSWKEVQKMEETYYNVEFENCINAIVKGDINSLKASIQSNPKLLHLQSQYGHQATLLHYTASNGVELWRQQTPQNLPEIIKLLLEEGADKNAKMNVYGGQFTAYELYISSAHPSDAGLDKSTADLLRI